MQTGEIMSAEKKLNLTVSNGEIIGLLLICFIISAFLNVYLVVFESPYTRAVEETRSFISGKMMDCTQCFNRGKKEVWAEIKEDRRHINALCWENQ